MKQILVSILQNFSLIVTRLNDLLTKLTNSLLKEKTLKLIKSTFNDSGRFYTFHFANNQLKKSKDLLRSIYVSLMNNQTFIEFGKFKIIIVTSIIDGQERAFHHNVLITNDTTFDQYYKQVEPHLNTNYYNDGDYYGVDVIHELNVTVWNMYDYQTKDITITKQAENVDS